MKDYLRKLKIIDNLTTTLQIDQTDFVKRLSSITDKGSTGLFSDSFDIFSSSKNELKGQVSYKGFKLKRKRRFFDTNMNMAVAIGTISKNEDGLTIETEINGFHNFFLVFYLFLILFYSIFIFGFGGSENDMDFFVIPFLMIHGGIMFSIPYFMMRRSVKSLKYELEREFFYLTKYNNSSH